MVRLCNQSQHSYSKQINEVNDRLYYKFILFAEKVEIIYINTNILVRIECNVSFIIGKRNYVVTH